MLLKQEQARKKLDEALKKKGVWIVAKKLHPYPLNLKSKVWNQGEEDGGYEHYLVFLVKKEQSRDFDVFFCVFFVFGREEKCAENV